MKQDYPKLWQTLDHIKLSTLSIFDCLEDTEETRQLKEAITKCDEGGELISLATKTLEIFLKQKDEHW